MTFLGSAKDDRKPYFVRLPNNALKALALVSYIFLFAASMGTMTGYW